MAIRETVKVHSISGSWCIIAKADFDPERHKLWDKDEAVPRIDMGERTAPAPEPEKPARNGWGGRRVKGKGRG